MKHTLYITLIIAAIFLVSQVVGLVTVNKYLVVDLIDGEPVVPTEEEPIDIVEEVEPVKVEKPIKPVETPGEIIELAPVEIAQIAKKI